MQARMLVRIAQVWRLLPGFGFVRPLRETTARVGYTDERPEHT
jgi:hypothetical protein